MLAEEGLDSDGDLNSDEGIGVTRAVSSKHARSMTVSYCSL